MSTVSSSPTRCSVLAVSAAALGIAVLAAQCMPASAAGDIAIRPFIVTHGWPGSVIEQVKIVDPLTNPTAHGGSASDAFHLVIPSEAARRTPKRPLTSRRTAS